MSKVTSTHAGVARALRTAVAATGKARETAAKAHRSLVQELAGLMRGGVTVNAVKDEVVRAGAEESLGFRKSYAQYVPVVADALLLPGAPSDVFGADGVAPIVARAAQAWKAAGEADGFADGARAVIAGASDWQAVADKFAKVIEAGKAASAAKRDKATSEAGESPKAVPFTFEAVLNALLATDPASLSAHARGQAATLAKVCAALAAGKDPKQALKR